MKEVNRPPVFADMSDQTIIYLKTSLPHQQKIITNYLNFPESRYPHKSMIPPSEHSPYCSCYSHYSCTSAFAHYQVYAPTVQTCRHSLPTLPTVSRLFCE